MERNAITKTGPLKTMNMLPAIFATIVATKQIRIMLWWGVGGGKEMEKNKLLKVPTHNPKNSSTG